MNKLVIQHHPGNSQISKKAGNAITKEKDGLFVSTTGVSISQKEGNAIKTEDDGLYVKSETEIKIGDGLKYTQENELSLDPDIIENQDIDFIYDDFDDSVPDDIEIRAVTNNQPDDIDFGGL